MSSTYAKETTETNTQYKLHVRKMSIEELEIKITTPDSTIIDSKTLSFSRYLLKSEQSTFMEIYQFKSDTPELSIYVQPSVDSFLITVVENSRVVFYKRVLYESLNVTPNDLNYLLTQ
mgnify:CR=1 FL=1